MSEKKTETIAMPILDQFTIEKILEDKKEGKSNREIFNDPETRRIIINIINDHRIQSEDRQIIITDDCKIETLQKTDLGADFTVKAYIEIYFEYYEEIPELEFQEIYSTLNHKLKLVLSTTPPRHSLHECLSYLEEEFLELREQTFKKESERNLDHIEEEYYDVLITGMRGLLFIKELRSKNYENRLENS